jgi:hypothetical protein
MSAVNERRRSLKSGDLRSGWIVSILFFMCSFFPFLFGLVGLAIASPLLSSITRRDEGKLFFPDTAEHNPDESDYQTAMEQA